MAAATAVAAKLEKPASILAKLVYPVSLAASLSLWLLAIRAPLWLDETLAYWQVSGGFAKIWSRSAQMPSSIGYLYTLWAAKSILGSQEIALKIPSTLAMLGAVYFLFRIASELFDQDIAFLACIFFCIHPDIVFAATDARPYAFALLATNAAIFLFLRWMTSHQMRDAVLFGAAAAGILYFHYLFGAILPAFAIYYLVLRGNSIQADSRQLAALVATFVLLALPLVVRVASLYQTRQTHVILEPPHWLVALIIFLPKPFLVGFFITVVLAALLRKVKLTGRDCYPAVLLCPLLALVPGGILYGISAATPMHIFIPRYCLVALPGTALTWGLLSSRIDSRWLRQAFCASLVGFTVYVSYQSPYTRKHELTFKPVFEFVNADAAQDQAPVLLCSGFIESNYEPMPDPASEDALLSQTSYYPLHAPTVLLPLDLNDETLRVASQAIRAAAEKRQRFLAVAGPASYTTLDWLASYSRGKFTSRVLRDFGGIVVAEFSPVPRD